MEIRLNKSLLLVITACFLVGCTINYDDQSEGIEKSDSIPDSEMKNFKMIQIKNNKLYTEVTATLAEIYNNQKKTKLYNVNFKEYDTEEIKPVTTGKADSIEYFNDTENAEIQGNLNFTSVKDEINMTGDYLYWNKDDKTLNSKNDSLIYVKKDDGSEIEGYGFRANLKNSTFSFDKGVAGSTK